MKMNDENFIKKLPAEDQKEYLKAYLKADQLENKKRCHNDFLSFVKFMWEDFISGYHHKIISEKFNKLASGEINRLIVNMPPRHTKSEFASFLFPAWLVGHDPKLKIIQTTHTTELAVRFGRKMKNLIDDPTYQQIFDKVAISADSKAAGRWETNHGGEYFAAGVGSAITGRGADLLIIDDPHSEQDALSETSLDSAYEWYTSGPRQRLQPGGAIVIVIGTIVRNGVDALDICIIFLKYHIFQILFQKYGCAAAFLKYQYFSINFINIIFVNINL